MPFVGIKSPRSFSQCLPCVNWLVLPYSTRFKTRSDLSSKRRICVPVFDQVIASNTQHTLRTAASTTQLRLENLKFTTAWLHLAFLAGGCHARFAAVWQGLACFTKVYSKLRSVECKTKAAMLSG